MSLKKMLELSEFLKSGGICSQDFARATLSTEAEVVIPIEVKNADSDEMESFIAFKAAKVADPEALLEGGFLRHIASDETLDRHGDIVSAKGWTLESYRKNPVILWAHSHSQPPVGKCVEIDVTRKKLIGVGEYPSKDVYEFGNTAFRLAALGYMRAVSVGFMPLKYELLDEEDPWGGVKVTEQDLWEYSIVPVPANPNALTLAAKGVIGFDVVRRWAEEVLDTREPSAAGNVHSDMRDSFALLGEALSKMSGSPLSINISLPQGSTQEEAELPDPVEEAEGDDMEFKEAFLSDTRDHDEEKGIGIRIVNHDDPVVLTIVDEPTFDVDIVAMQKLISDSLDRRRGRLVDKDLIGG